MLLFDFDGTLVDSFNCVVLQANLLADKYNFRKIKPEEIESLHHLSSLQIIKLLRVPYYFIPSLIYQLKKTLYSEMLALNPVNHIYDVLEVLYQEEIPLAILTSNSKRNVEKWLHHNQMHHFFKFIQAEANYFNKRNLLKKTIRTYKMNPSCTYYIGDESRDIEAAKQCQINSIAVTWGYQSEKILIQSQPTYLVRNPSELLKICRNLSFD